MSKHTGQFSHSYISWLISIKSSENVSENVFFLVIVWNCQQSLSQQFDHLHDAVLFNRGVSILTDSFPVVLNNFDESIFVWDLHWYFSESLDPLIDSDFALKILSCSTWVHIEDEWSHFRVFDIVNDLLSSNFPWIFTAIVESGPKLLNHCDFTLAHILVA